MRRSRLLWIGAVALGLGLLLWPRRAALRAGFHTDDTVQMAMLEGTFPAPRSPWDLYRFADGAKDGNALVNFGYHPWWSDPDLRIAMFRPLSSLLLAADHRAHGSNAAAWHAHSFAWGAALFLSCAALLRRLLPGAVAAVALGLFAIDESMNAPIVWLANRSTLVATTFAVLAFWVHVRPTAASTRARAVETLLALLALLGGEYAVALLAYIPAYEAFGREGPRRDRIRAALPVVVLTLGYVVVRPLLGYGVRGSAYYLSPTDDPFGFALAAVHRIPVLIGDLVLGFPAALWTTGVPWARTFEAGQRQLEALGVVGAALFAIALREGLPVGTERLALALSAGALASLLPGLGALPEDRLLVAASLGASTVYALLLVEAARRIRGAVVARRVDRGLAVSVVVALGILHAHVHVAWGRTAGHADRIALLSGADDRWAMEARIPPGNVGAQRWFFLSAAGFSANAHLPWVRRMHGLPLPRSCWRLSGTQHVHEIRRTAPDVLEVIVLASHLEGSFTGSLYRARDRPLTPGQRVRLDGLTVEVEKAIDGNPWWMRLTFDRSLDDPNYVFLHAMPEGMMRLALPPVGGKTRLPSPAGPRIGP